MWSSQQVRVQNSCRRSSANFALPERFAEFGIGREIMANLGVKAAECAPLSANDLIRKGRNITWNDRLNPIAPVSNTIWSPGGFEGNCTNLAMDGTKADSQLQERAGMRIALNQRAPSAEMWGIAALDQRRKRTQDHLAKIAPRRERWIKHNRYYYDLLSRLPRFLVEPPGKDVSNYGNAS
jgi:hypothetical protein